MASPTLTLVNHQLLTTADTSTGWNDLTTADADIKVEGANSMSGIFRADGEQGYYDSGTAPVTGAGKTFRGWILTNNLPYMGTLAGDPYKLLMFDGTTTELKALFGSDTYEGGWFNIVWDVNDFTTLTLANIRRWGVEAGHAANGKNVVNTWMDVMRYLDGYSMTGGTSGDKVTLATIAASDKTNAYGVMTAINGVYFCAGLVQFGTGATPHYFEMDGQVLVFIDKPVSATLYKLAGVGTGTNIVISSSVLRATTNLTRNRFDLDFDDADLASLTFTDNLVVRAGLSYFKSGQTCTGNTFDDCGQITHGGANFTGTSVLNYEGTTGTAALLYNVNADPDGEVDDMTFVKGTTATHAIELGTNTPTSITLRGWTVSGYNASNEQNDSVIYNNSGKTITVNVVDNTGTISYRNGAGASTVIVANPVTTTITVRDVNTGLAIPGTVAGQGNTFEGGSDGVAITELNSGGASGAAWDVISASSGAAVVYDTDRATKGSLVSGLYTTGGTAGTVVTNWILAEATEHWGRAYLYAPADPGTNLEIVRFENNGFVGDIQLRTTGEIALRDSTSTARFFSASPIPNNQWVRLEWHWVHSTTTGHMEARIYHVATSGTPTETIGDLTSNYNTGASVDEIRFGIGTAISNYELSMDNIYFSTQDWPGPSTAGPRVYVEAAAGGPLAQGTVIINAVTDLNGQVSDTRTLASDQPITGWVRKGTTSPLYQQGNIAGSISSSVGLNLTVQLVPDE